jgi:hypothetical protein
MLLTREFVCENCGQPIFLSFDAAQWPDLPRLSVTKSCPWGCGHEAAYDIPGSLISFDKKL